MMSESIRFSRGQWFALAAAFLGWMFDGLVLGLLPLVSRPALKDILNITDDATVGLWHGRMVACFLVGAACGGVFFGWLGDKFGRVRTMIFSILAYSIFTGCGYFATQPWHLGVFFFLAALGLGGQWSLGVALVMECWPEKARPVLAGVIGAASNVGFLMIAVVGACHPVTPDSWRWLMLVGASPAVLALFIAFFVPESQRWKNAAQKGGGSPIVEIFKPALRRKTLLAIAFASIPLIGTWGAVSGWLPMWMDQLAEKGGDHSGHAKALSQIIVSIGAITGCLLAPIIGGKWGRRPVYFGLCLLALLFCQGIFRGFTAYSTLLVLTTFILGLFTAAFYGWMPLYLPELFPTRVRATGQGLSFNFGRIVAAFGAVYMGQLTHFFQGDYGRAMATITLIYVLGLVLIWFAPETKGKPLPD
jgi:MFS transporter, SHS family, sialic acid transporter